MARSSNNDFKIDELVKSDQHQKDIGDLDKRIKALEDKFGTHELIADTLCITADKQANLQEMLTSFIIKQIKESSSVQKEITNYINSADREWAFSMVKKIGFAGWTIIVLIVGAILYAFFAQFFK